MSSPICDFVRRYNERRPARFHMPGHKGSAILGFEALDITEIDGADELFTADGIIAKSEAQAGALFGAHTVYATGGSTLCIQAMLHLSALYAAAKGRDPVFWRRATPTRRLSTPPRCWILIFSGAIRRRIPPMSVATYHQREYGRRCTAARKG